jgi:hypothetical protein
MSDKDIRRYNQSVCPRCDVQVPVTDVSVDENLYTTFYYKCKCGLSWTKLRGLELTQEELMSMVALTKKLNPRQRDERRPY